MYIGDNDWAKITPEELLNSLRLASALKTSWDKDTTHPNEVANWNNETPTIGQCAVTSLVVHDYLSGDLHKNPDLNHYWNCLPSGAFVDFTHEQFQREDAIESRGVPNRKQLLTGERAEKAQTKTRYKLLKKRVKHSMKDLESTLVLISSNAQAEYLLDIVEAIGTPEKTLHHFRYELKY